MYQKYFFKSFIAGIAISLMTLSCSKSDDIETFEPQTYNVGGKVEKGPFVSGSTITMQPMNAKMQPSGQMYTTTIQDNTGSFTFGSKLFDAPFAELTANGYFFNEVNGVLSSGTLNLRAIVDLSNQSTINVNILTHLKYQRILNLVGQGSNFRQANEQAQKELFTAFGLSQYADTDASLFSIVKGNDESAALIAVSSLLLVDRSEAELTEYLAKLSQEFGKEGIFSPETKEQIKEDKKKIVKELSRVRTNIIERYNDLGVSVEVKELERFFDWDDDGSAETMNALSNNRGGKEILFATFYEGNLPSDNPTAALSNLIPVMTYTDVVLSYAECLYKNGKTSGAKTQLNAVVAAKDIEVSNENVLTGIAEARKQLLLYCASNFAFMKRNGMAEEEYGVESYRLLLPIPMHDMNTNPAMTQNPGY